MSLDRAPAPQTPTPADVLVCALARELVDGDVVATGVSSPLALLAIGVARATHAPGCTWLACVGALDPPLRALHGSTEDLAYLEGRRAEITIADLFDHARRGRIDVVLHAFGSAENLRLESVPEPRPAPGEILLRVHACGVCHHDLINRRGNLLRTQVPAILGHEAAGEVVEVGAGVTGWSIGDRAATLQRLSCGRCPTCLAGRNSLCRNDARFFGEEIPGGYATYLAAPVAGLGRVPRDLPWDAAATACCTTGTAVHVVRSRGQVCPEETVLITGASGGVGLQAVQLARLDGARVIAVTSSASKVETLQAAGAHDVVVAPDLEFAAEVRRLTDGAGVDVAIEIVGSRTFAQTLRCMAAGGRVVVVGNLDTGSVQLNPGLVIVKEMEILGAYATTAPELEEAFGLLRSGELLPYVSDALPLAEAARAHDLLEHRKVAGRLVLLPG